MPRETPGLVAMDWVRTRPGPTAELSPPIILESLRDLFSRVHDERAVLNDGLTDGATLEDEELHGLRAGRHGRRYIWAEDELMTTRDGAPGHLKTSAVDHVDRSIGPRLRSRQSPCRIRRQTRGPDRQVAVGARGPAIGRR